MSTNTKTKIKLSRILDDRFQISFEKLLHVPFVNLRDSWAVSKTLAQLNQEIDTFSKLRNAKILTYGEEKDGSTAVKAENKDLFLKEINEIMDQDVEIYLDHVITVADNTKPINAEKSLTALDFMMLEGLVNMGD